MPVSATPVPAASPSRPQKATRAAARLGADEVSSPPVVPAGSETGELPLAATTALADPRPTSARLVAARVDSADAAAPDTRRRARGSSFP